MNLRIILASQSSYKKAQFEKLGLVFNCEAPQVDESPSKEKEISPREVAEELAFLKARDVFNRNSEALVIGADQILEFEGNIFDKPGTRQNACSQLSLMAGKTHMLHTSFCLLAPNLNPAIETITSRLTMRDLDSEQIEKYIEKDLPIDCCGSYIIEEAGISLFDHIETSDFSAIIGLPLLALNRKIRQLAHF